MCVCVCVCIDIPLSYLQLELIGHIKGIEGRGEGNRVGYYTEGGGGGGGHTSRHQIVWDNLANERSGKQWADVVPLMGTNGRQSGTVSDGEWVVWGLGMDRVGWGLRRVGDVEMGWVGWGLGEKISTQRFEPVGAYFVARKNNVMKRSG